jgi:hypothetical protein
MAVILGVWAVKRTLLPFDVVLILVSFLFGSVGGGGGVVGVVFFVVVSDLFFFSSVVLTRNVQTKRSQWKTTTATNAIDG